MVRMRIYLPERMIRELEELKERLQLPASEIIRRAIDEYIEKMKERRERDEDRREKEAVGGKLLRPFRRP